MQGILVPAGTPKPIIDLLNREIVAIMELPDVKEKLVALGFETVASSPQEFADRIAPLEDAELLVVAYGTAARVAITAIEQALVARLLDGRGELLALLRPHGVRVQARHAQARSPAQQTAQAVVADAQRLQHLIVSDRFDGIPQGYVDTDQNCAQFVTGQHHAYRQVCEAAAQVSGGLSLQQLRVG